MLISVSGLDGAGKSTCVEWIRTELARARRGVTVLHQNDHVGVYAATRALRDRMLGRAGRPEEPPRLAPRPTRLGRARDAIVWNATLRRLLYPVDLLIFLAVRLWVERLRGRVLLMDRYFYDTLVDFAAREGRVRRDLLLRLTPRPDLAVYLDIDPHEAYARKGEYSVAYLARRAEAYRALFPHLPTALRLAASDRESVRRAVAAAMRERSVA